METTPTPPTPTPATPVTPQAAPIIGPIQHVGVTVSDLGRSLAFYRDVLGFEPLFVTDGSGPDLARTLGVPDADLSFAQLRLGDTLLELLQYRHPAGRPYDRGNRGSADVGAYHVGLRVADIEETYRALAARGVAFTAPPLHVAAGPLAGGAFTYFADPDGLTWELFQPAA